MVIGEAIANEFAAYCKALFEVKETDEEATVDSTRTPMQSLLCSPHIEPYDTRPSALAPRAFRFRSIILGRQVRLYWPYYVLLHAPLQVRFNCARSSG